ncbi:hypothetical protein MyNCGM683_15520 [Achromobacter xylosoxidans]
MHDTRWRAIIEQIRALPEHQRGQLRYGPHTLTLERRGEVIVALRMIEPSEALVLAADLAWRSGADTPLPFKQDGQLLRIGKNYYLCSWRRQPTDWDWLIALATARL